MSTVDLANLADCCARLCDEDGKEIEVPAGDIEKDIAAPNPLRAGLAIPVHPNGRTLSRHNGSILRK